MKSKYFIRGFSYIELMIVLAISAALMLLIGPSFSGVMAQQKSRTSAVSFQKDIKFARQEAMDSKESVIICATADGLTCNATTLADNNQWQTGRIIFADRDNNGIPAFSETLLVRFGDNFNSGSVITTSAANLRNRIIFDSDGRSRSAAGAGTIRITHGNSEWHLILNTIGVPRVELKS